MDAPKLKIRFLVDHDVFDEEEKSFVKGEVVNMVDSSAMHYVSRKLAEVVPNSTKVHKPERQIEIPVEQSPDLDEKVLSFREKVAAWLASFGSDTKIEDAESGLAALLPEATEKANLILDKATEDANAIVAQTNEETKAILDQTDTDAKSMMDMANEQAKAIVARANEEAKEIVAKAKGKK